MPWIIATVWPATQSAEKLKQLYDNWVRILRFNCSHATHDWMKEVIQSASDSKELAELRHAAKAQAWTNEGKAGQAVVDYMLSKGE